MTLVKIRLKTYSSKIQYEKEKKSIFTQISDNCCAHDLDKQVLDVRKHISRCPNESANNKLITFPLKNSFKLEFESQEFIFEGELKPKFNTFLLCYFILI